ncbi:MAG: manganese efflux pump MntP family protein [Victivallaceae bacterium]|nr:manganese efflux pump MntP family protein [Victivallaceae bacterium]
MAIPRFDRRRRTHTLTMVSFGQLAEPFLLGVALAADAFGVSVGLGIAGKGHFGGGKKLFSSALFGGFQFLMPVAGFFCAALGGESLQNYGRWIAAFLLCGIGVNMIRQKHKKESVSASLPALLLLAVATSIDAFLVGIGFRCVGNDALGRDAAIIGAVTFVIAFAGAAAGEKCGGKIAPDRAAYLGGAVLIALGVKTLLV